MSNSFFSVKVRGVVKKLKEKKKQNGLQINIPRIDFLPK